MSRNLTKTPAFKLELFLEHPKNERLHQTAAFKPRWRIVFLILYAYEISIVFCRVTSLLMLGTDENHTFQGVVVPEHLQKRAPATNLGSSGILDS